jgi:hypothetical protein
MVLRAQNQTAVDPQMEADFESGAEESYPQITQKTQISETRNQRAKVRV